MNIAIEQSGACQIVMPDEPRLDRTNAGELVDVCKNALRQNAFVILDLSRVGFMDSSGLGAVIGGLKEGTGQGRVCLCSLQGPVRRLFHLARLTQLFKVADSRDEALEELAQR